MPETVQVRRGTLLSCNLRIKNMRIFEVCALFGVGGWLVFVMLLPRSLLPREAQAGGGESTSCRW